MVPLILPTSSDPNSSSLMSKKPCGFARGLRLCRVGLKCTHRYIHTYIHTYIHVYIYIHTHKYLSRIKFSNKQAVYNAKYKRQSQEPQVISPRPCRHTAVSDKRTPQYRPLTAETPYQKLLNLRNRHSQEAQHGGHKHPAMYIHVILRRQLFRFSVQGIGGAGKRDEDCQAEHADEYCHQNCCPPSRPSSSSSDRIPNQNR